MKSNRMPLPTDWCLYRSYLHLLI